MSPAVHAGVGWICGTASMLVGAACARQVFIAYTLMSQSLLALCRAWQCWLPSFCCLSHCAHTVLTLCHAVLYMFQTTCIAGLSYAWH